MEGWFFSGLDFMTIFGGVRIHGVFDLAGSGRRPKSHDFFSTDFFRPSGHEVDGRKKSEKQQLQVSSECGRTFPSG
jgi:hypothetical protein